MRAFHSNWTRPFFLRHPEAKSYHPEPFELLTTALSALLWQQENGSIAMLCDGPAAAFYTEWGLSSLWNDGIHTVLDDIDSAINPSIFWAAGKLYALRHFGAPCVMIDTDFIVWRPLEPLLKDKQLACIHKEELSSDVYPPRESLPAFPDALISGLDWTVLPANTALSFFGDAAFTRSYTDHAIALMSSAPQADHPLTYMVFTEQRLLAMLAHRQGVPLDALSDLFTLFHTDQQYFTHVWGFKQQMRENPMLYHDFCRRCAVRLARDYPCQSQPLRRIPFIAPYFEGL